jgi:EAL domain-containing protein (putative c-di-GMP-specific phosphodiesterase class I)
LVKDFAGSNEVLARLVAAGVRVAIDDFGTGYSSLGYLKDLVFDTLKIDRVFVANLPDDKALAIVKAIVAVARALGKEVVAEGIETESQRVQLTALQCTFAQGFLFSRPLSAEDVILWVHQTAGGARRANAAYQR